MKLASLRQRAVLQAALHKAQLVITGERAWEVTVAAPEGTEWASMGTDTLYCARVLMNSDEEVWESILNLMRAGLRQRRYRVDGEAVAVINVHLKTCQCGPDPHCTHNNAPAVIPSQVPSFFSVQVCLAACDCFHRGLDGRAAPPPAWVHTANCASRPWLATSSIVTPDGSWARSEVGKVDWHVRNEHGDWRPSAMTNEELERAMVQVRQRWAIVKALLTTEREVWAVSEDTRLAVPLAALLEDRDEVFAALVEMVRHEDGAAAAQERVGKRLPRWPFFIHRARSWCPMDVPSASALAEYVAKLLAQVRDL